MKNEMKWEMKSKLMIKTITLGLVLSTYTFGAEAATITGGNHDVNGTYNAGTESFANAESTTVLNATGDTVFNITGAATGIGGTPILGVNADGTTLTVNGNNHDITFNGTGGAFHTAMGKKNTEINVIGANNITSDFSKGRTIWLKGANNQINLDAKNDIVLKNTSDSDGLIQAETGYYFGDTIPEGVESTLSLKAGNDIKLSGVGTAISMSPGSKFDAASGRDINIDADSIISGVSNQTYVNLSAGRDFNANAKSGRFLNILGTDTEINIKAGNNINLTGGEAEDNAFVLQGGKVTLEAGNDLNILEALNTPSSGHSIIYTGDNQVEFKAINGSILIDGVDDTVKMTSHSPGNLTMKAKKDITLNTASTAGNVDICGYMMNFDLDSQTGNVNLLNTNSQSTGATLKVDRMSTVNIKAGQNVNVGGNIEQAVNVAEKSNVTLEAGQNGSINLEAKNNNTGENLAVKVDGENTVLTLKSDTNAKAVKEGLVGTNKGVINAEKGLSIKGAATAINLATGAVLNAKDLTRDKQIEGKILVDGAGTKANLGFGTANSYYTGGLNPTNGGEVNIALENGGTWNVTEDSNVTSLDLGKKGILNLTQNSTNKYKTVKADNFSTQGGDIVFDTDLASEENSDKLVIASQSGANGTIQVKDVSLENGTEVVSNKKVLLVTDTTGEASFTGEKLEGDGLWDTTPTIEKEGNNWYLTKVEAEKSKDAETIYGNQKATTGLWRAVMTDDSLRTRLGDVRSHEGEGGIWARNKSNKQSGDGFDARGNTFQIGIDKKIGNALYGLALDRYTDSNTFAAGSGSNAATAFSLYAANIQPSGYYSDAVVRFGKMDGDYHTTNQYNDRGSYDTHGFSLSYEVGKKFDRGSGFFIEPQGQLVYGSVGGYDYTTAKGVKVKADGNHSVLGRLGFNIGRTVNKDSEYYLKVNAYHDFSGDASTSMLAANGQAVSYKESLGGTWYELGIGGSAKISKKTHLYGDISRTFGGEINKDWQINAGLRFEF